MTSLDLGPLEPLAHDGYGLLEGPRADRDGGVHFADVLGGGVHRVAPDGAVATVIPKRRGVGGILIHRDGGVVVSGRDLAHARGDETRTLLRLDGVEGFNDIFTDAEGRVLAGALRFNPLKGEQPVPGEIWRVRGPEDAEVLVVGIDWPNGIGISPEGNRLYVSDYARGEVLSWSLAGDGEATGRERFAVAPRGSCDGLAVDQSGAVWVALGEGGAVARFDPDGGLAGILDVPAGFVSSVSFGGADRRDLFLTAVAGDLASGGTLFGARAPVAGVPVPDAAV